MVMPNSETYEAILKCERWRDTILLSVRDIPRLQQDMDAVIQTIKRQSDDTKSLRLSNLALKQNRKPPGVRHFGRGSLVSASLSTAYKAQQVAEAAGDGPIDVYRYQIGTVRWLKHGTKYTGKGEFIGTYDQGCDWRRIEEDLRA